MGFALMHATLASLPESFLTPIDAADERFLAGVRVHVLGQVLLKGEFFVALWTWKRFL